MSELAPLQVRLRLRLIPAQFCGLFHGLYPLFGGTQINLGKG